MNFNTKYKEKIFKKFNIIKYDNNYLENLKNKILKMTAIEWDNIYKIIKDENIYGIIIGKPYHLDGSVSEMIQNVEKFFQEILQVY